jgi:hypothetical protein
MMGNAGSIRQTHDAGKPSGRLSCTRVKMQKLNAHEALPYKDGVHCYAFEQGVADIGYRECLN